MILIIDGYNVLRMWYNYIVSEHERTIFINQLKKYAIKKKLKIVLVFDGGIMPWSEESSSKTLKVIYVGKNVTADEYIEKYIKKNQNKELLVVSSDHQIQNYAKEYNIESVDAELFLKFFDKTFHKIDSRDKKQKNIVVKMHQEKMPDLDRLMSEAYVSSECGPDSFKKKMECKNVSEKLSKKEKKLKRLLEKL